MRTSVIVPYSSSPRKSKTLPLCLSHLKGQADEVLVEEGGVDAELRALRRASGDVILFTDCDCYVPINWVKKHLSSYPYYDMVLGAPSQSFKFLSFRNFSIKREIIQKFGLRDVPNHDFDFACRILKSGIRYRYRLDPSIRVFHDDQEPVPPDKLFSYAVNIALLSRRYGLLPNREDLRYLKSPRVLAGILFALSMPTSAPFRAFRRQGKYRGDHEY